MEEKKTKRNEETKKLLISRLNKIEGQIRGLKRLIEDDTYCTDLLIQTNAAKSALESFSTEVLKNHIMGCVKKGLQNGDDSVVDELIWTLKKLK
ncbi:MAG: metal-sensing transcriptional repressor [Treponema sp.]|nr:metal-sensing transcriptional repressor [Treponema sp.]